MIYIKRTAERYDISMDSEKYISLLERVCIPENTALEEALAQIRPLNDFLEAAVPEKLYRYRSCNELSLNALLQDEVWFSKPSKMNDDFDAMISYDLRKCEEKIVASFDLVNHIVNAIRNGDTIEKPFDELISRPVIEKIKRASEEEWTEAITKAENVCKNKFRTRLPLLASMLQENHKIACFSESIKSPLMWGHYANSSTGFALAYDFRNFAYCECSDCLKTGEECKKRKDCILLPIIYGNIPYDATEYISWLYQMRALEENRELTSSQYQIARAFLPCPDKFMSVKILLHKSKEWEPEKEWRLACHWNDPEIQKRDYSYVIKKPVALYMGRKIKPIDENKLITIARDKGIPVYKMEIGRTTYSLKPKLLSMNN